MPSDDSIYAFEVAPDVAQALARLRAGGLIAFPTETVYGLGASALDADAVQRVFDVKGRPSNNPLIVHVADAAMARTVVRDWPTSADRISAAFWPGPLSIVLPKAECIPTIVTGGGPNVAVRCPDHPLTLALLRAFGPLVGPSANPSGRVSPTTAEHVRASFTPEQVLVLDGGPCRAGIESTVLSLAGHAPRILRPGVISAASIAHVLSISEESLVAAAPTSNSSGTSPLASPGLLESHYAPRARAVLCAGADVLAEFGSKRVVFLGPASWVDTIARSMHTLTMPDDASAYAANIYAALRDADALSPDLIVIADPRQFGRDPADPVWIAVLDRLNRATSDVRTA